MKGQWCCREGPAGYGKLNTDREPTPPGSCIEAKKGRLMGKEVHVTTRVVIL